MTAYATYTPIAIPRYPFNEIHTTATQADNDGDVVEMGSGLFGVVQGLAPGPTPSPSATRSASAPPAFTTSSAMPPRTPTRTSCARLLRHGQ